MNEQEKYQIPETEEQPQSQTGQDDEHHDRIKETTEKIWDGTKHAWNTAAFKANQYKKLVQKKIDQSALHKKINLAHADLGKLIDDLRESGKKNIMTLVEVKELLAKIDELKAEAATIEEDVERIRNEVPPRGDLQEEAKTD